MQCSVGNTRMHEGGQNPHCRACTVQMRPLWQTLGIVLFTFKNLSKKIFGIFEYLQCTNQPGERLERAG